MVFLDDYLAFNDEQRKLVSAVLAENWTSKKSRALMFRVRPGGFPIYPHDFVDNKRLEKILNKKQNAVLKGFLSFPIGIIGVSACNAARQRGDADLKRVKFKFSQILELRVEHLMNQSDADPLQKIKARIAIKGSVQQAVEDLNSFAISKSGSAIFELNKQAFFHRSMRKSIVSRCENTSAWMLLLRTLFKHEQLEVLRAEETRKNLVVDKFLAEAFAKIICDELTKSSSNSLSLNEYREFRELYRERISQKFRFDSVAAEQALLSISKPDLVRVWGDKRAGEFWNFFEKKKEQYQELQDARNFKRN